MVLVQQNTDTGEKKCLFTGIVTISTTDTKDFFQKQKDILLIFSQTLSPYQLLHVFLNLLNVVDLSTTRASPCASSYYRNQNVFDQAH